MRLPSFISSAVSLLALVAGSASALHAAVGNRIQHVTSTQRVAVPNTISPRVLHAADAGEAPADRTLNAVTLRFNMTDAQTAALDQLLAAQQNPASPQYHQWLTPEQFDAQFGLSQADVAQVTAWLSGQGLKVTGTARGGSFVTVSGTVRQMEKAFSTSIHTLTIDGEQHIANVTDPALPPEIAAVTGTVTGLSDIHPRPRVHAHYTSSISGSHYMAPGDFYTIYDTNPLLSSNVNGQGVTIAVMGQTDISTADVSAFRAASGLSTTNLPTTMLYGTNPGTSTSDIDEAMLDVEWSGAVAPNASILYVNSTDVIGTSLTQAVDNNLAPIITISYGDCESGFGASNITSFNNLFKQANAQGQTIVGPAGDSGATDCDYSTSTAVVTSAVNGLAVDFPASSPNVTGVGGSEFNEGSGNYWNTTNGAFTGSALSYIPEMVWNETALGGGLASGGGGASQFFTKPAYQVGTGVPVDYSRDVPDLSLDAAASHDGYLICSQGFCTNAFRNAAGNLDVVGGTSVSTPSFAGILALLEQKIGPKLGNVNPTIYGLANSTYYNNVFHDITVGNNAQPCTAGTPNCPNGGPIGYNAAIGYDQATGWGSVDAFNLVNDWQSVTAAGLTSTIGSNASATALSLSATSTTSGTPVTLTVTVSSATAGLTTTPTGTVQFIVDGTVTGTGVTLTGGSATYSLATTGFASGNHTIQAAYTGDTNYNGSKSTVTLDIVSASAADFTITPSTTTTTVAPGGTAPGITFTIKPVNSFTGSVTFSATTGSSSLAATYSFSVNPVTVLGTSSPTTVLTLVASSSDAISGTGLIRLNYVPAATAGHASLTTGSKPLHGVPSALGLAGSGAALAGLLLFTLPHRNRRSSSLLGLTLVVVLGLGLIGLSGCGGGAATAASTTTNAAAGSYPITVTATSTTASGAAISHSQQVTLVVN